MRHPIAAFLLIISGLVIATSSAAMPANNANEPLPQRFARVYEAASPPIGWVQFCQAQPAECAAETASDGAAGRALSDADWSTQMMQINVAVNHMIEGISDNDHYGIYKMNIVNWWTYPDDGKGNCNDYALLKRKLLIEAGWPRSALMLTVVLDKENEGHLVLMVRRRDGDFILDNLVDDIKIWNTTGYTYIKRQSSNDPSTWLRLEPGRTRQQVAISMAALARNQQ